MAVKPDSYFDYDINPSTYDWSVRVFRILKKLLSVNFKLQGDPALVDQGNIFLFNHFARFETFIPQYLIYEANGAYCCSVASGEFFQGDDVFSNFLRGVGAVPHNHKRLLPMLAAQILRGRKVVIFPEGGMVKDRQVLDKYGRYSVYSRIAMDRRKHHSGAAVLGLALDAFKMVARQAFRELDEERLRKWVTEYRLGSIDALLSAVKQPTVIVPANITFYPIRVSDNVLRKGAEMLNQGLSLRHSEELLIEGNLLLKDTDMDIQLGAPIYPAAYWRFWEKWLLDHLAPSLGSLDDVFALRRSARNRREKLLVNGMQRHTAMIRNQYMQRMYHAVTINLSHLAASLIMRWLRQGRTEIGREEFHRTLYFAVKLIQKISGIHLHRSLRNPEAYRDLVREHHEGLQQFMGTARASALVEPLPDRYQFLPKLAHEQHFDQIRMENPVAVYANEVAPILVVEKVVNKAQRDALTLNPIQLAELYFDDEMLSWLWDTAYFSKPWFEAINKQETATQNSQPFLLQPLLPNGYGIVLVHGFLASPAEVRGFADKLVALGFTVLGVRLKGHGTSPHDLKERSWEDWFASVRRGYEILEPYVKGIYLVGFATGGALALRLAADQPDQLAGVAALSVPVKFENSTMMVGQLMHGANALMRWMPSFKGRPFIVRDSEHPEINYRNVPVRGLYEVRRLIQELDDRLKDVHCPVLLLHGDKDPIIDADSSRIIFRKLGSKEKELVYVRSNRLSILLEDIDGTQGKVISFLTETAKLAYQPVQTGALKALEHKPSI
jgi:esterase/lipase